MTAHEKAIAAINARLERLQANLRETQAEAAQRYLVQALVATIAVADALNDFAKAIGRYAERRHAEVKQANAALGAEHTSWLNAGRELLEKLKANPTDSALRKEIDAIQKNMAAVQKSVRRGANALQRELAPGLARIDPLALAVRRFAEADQIEALKRALKMIIAEACALYAAQPGLPHRNLVDAAAWEKSATAAVAEGTGFFDAQARAGHQATLALEAMAIAMAENPPATADEVMQRAGDAAAQRLQAVAARFAQP